MTAQPQASVLSLGPELTIAYAASTQAVLAAALDATRDGDLPLDLSGVSDFDSSGVQLLLSTRASLRERGQDLQLVATSSAVRDALATFGLLDLLQTGQAMAKETPHAPR